MLISYRISYIILLFILLHYSINGANHSTYTKPNNNNDNIFITNKEDVVIILIGTRPDVSKLSILILDLKYRWKRSNIQFIVINTGQHKEMLEPMLNYFNLTIDITLDMMGITNTNSNTNTDTNTDSMAVIISKSVILLENCLNNIRYRDVDVVVVGKDKDNGSGTNSNSNSNASENIYTHNTIKIKPRMMVVQGDTNTALIGGLSSFYRSIPLVHIEAGLRTWNNEAPFPEEFNRRVVDILCTLCVAPTIHAKRNQY